MDTKYIYLIFLHLCNGFNFDEQFPIIYENPTRNEKNENKQTYFGYSVILNGSYDHNKPWIQIGAPRANVTDRNYRYIKEPGTVFRCLLKEPCEQITVDNTGNEYREGLTSAQSYRDRKDGAWIGGSMDIDYKSNRAVVCGHRWSNQYKNRFGDFYMEGVCYVLENNRIIKLIPLNDADYSTHPAYKINIYYYVMGQAGISVHFPNYTDTPEMLVGAPGIFNWQGTAILIKDGNTSPIAANRRRRQFDPINTLSTWIIPDPNKDYYSSHFDYEGYDVTSGKYFSRDELIYVMGGPRSQKCKGQVILFNFPETSNDRITILNKRQGQSTGEYFGSVLATADITGDGLDDLIVGAPMYSKDWDEGRVYIFLGSLGKDLQTPEQTPTIDGTFPGGRFGSAIMSLGDIDYDGFEDIVVGAPYEDNHRGVIYIYNGNRQGLFETYSQRIVAKNIYENLRGFGISFSRAVDIDDNHYSDIAVGSYLSGHAVIFRSKPVVKLGILLRALITRLARDAKKFQVEACVWYEGPSATEVIPPHIDVERRFTVDEEFSRAYLNKFPNVSTFYHNITLHKKVVNCTTFDIILKKNVTNYINPIHLSLSQTLIQKNLKGNPIIIGEHVTGHDDFHKNYPVISNKISSKDVHVELPFALECGLDNICKSDLKLNVSLIGISEEFKYIIGSSEILYLNMTIINIGEPAYLAEINVTLPENVNIFKVPSAFLCEENANNVLCLVDNPLREGVVKHLILELDMKNVGRISTLTKNTLQFNISLTTKSDEINPNDNVKNIQLALAREADFFIFDITKHDSFSYAMNEDEKTIKNNITFQHFFEIRKTGASPIEEVYVNISVPTHWKTSERIIRFLQIYEPEGSYSGQPFLCKSNINYLLKSDKQFEKMVELNEDSKLLRKKRNTETTKASTDTELNLAELPSANRTLFLNCSSVNVICQRITCFVGPFRHLHLVARLQLKMVLNMTEVSDTLLEKKDIVYLSTDGYVQIKSSAIQLKKSERVNSVRVSSIFIRSFLKSSIPLWIILLAVIIGLFLLLLITATLTKAGFFQRKKKDELKALIEAQNETEFEFEEQCENEDTKTVSDIVT